MKGLALTRIQNRTHGFSVCGSKCCVIFSEWTHSLMHYLRACAAFSHGRTPALRHRFLFSRSMNRKGWHRPNFSQLSFTSLLVHWTTERTGGGVPEYVREKRRHRHAGSALVNVFIQKRSTTLLPPHAEPCVRFCILVKANLSFRKKVVRENHFFHGEIYFSAFWLHSLSTSFSVNDSFDSHEKNSISHVLANLQTRVSAATAITDFCLFPFAV